MIWTSELDTKPMMCLVCHLAPWVTEAGGSSRSAQSQLDHGQSETWTQNKNMYIINRAGITVPGMQEDSALQK